MIRDHDQIRSYLHSVCGQIKAREVHPHIRKELEGHLEELVLEREEAGADRDEAVRYAIEQMGDPIKVGKGLHSVHRPRMNWSILVGVLFFALLGILSMYLVDSNYQYPVPLLEKKVVSVVVGLLMMTFLYFTNPRTIQKYCWAFYSAAIGGMIGCHWFGISVNGSPSYISIGGISFDWVWISTYLLIIAAAGILIDRMGKPYFWLFTTSVLVLVPLILFASLGRLPSLLLYLTALLIMTGSITRKWVPAFGQTVLTVTVVSVIALLIRPNAAERLNGFINPDQDPLGAGFAYVQIQNALQSAGWLGHGSEAPYRLPEAHTDMIFVYLVNHFGWLAGIIIGLTCACFAAALIRSSRSIHDPYGRALLMGIASIIGFQLGYNVLMSLGFAPIMGIPLPLVSYGFTHTVMELSILGLALAVYRKKSLLAERVTNILS